MACNGDEYLSRVLRGARNLAAAPRKPVSFGNSRRDSRIRGFRVLSRQQQLLADRVPVELGARAFDLLLVLLEADGSLVTKKELLSRVWPGIVVSEENLKVQVSALRKALGADRDVIRTEFGRGYRFTGVLRSNAAAARANLRRGQSCGLAELCCHRTGGNRSGVVSFRATQRGQ
jgi:DNA-binding winged helix-turn-helix (wHTH) protein